MKYLLFAGLMLLAQLVLAQNMVNPVIKGYGGIYEIPTATVEPDSDLTYNIIVDLFTGAEYPDSIAWSLNNVARMINLHAVGGVPPESIHIVLAIHAKATNTILNNKAYNKRYGIDNPNYELIKELKNAGVKLTVCGQSLLARQILSEDVLEEVEIATSMLTTVTTYQLKGYAYLKF